MRIGSTLTLATVVLLGGCGQTTLTSPTTVADTDLLQREFSSLLLPGGSASREFDIVVAGPIAVTLKTTTPGDVPVGVGVGIPRSNGSCALSAAVDTAAGSTAQISINAAAGTYCAKVYDLGTLLAPMAFTIAISRP
ncbi:MAG TPA: hypothetical protein VF491_14635 [Vicinamibacterales bacterium]